MMRTVYSALLVLLLATVTMGVDCKKDIGDPPKYNFKTPISLFPSQAIYDVGDTINISFKTDSKSFIDTVSGVRVNTNDLRLAFGAAFIKKYEAPSNPSDGFCDFILPAGVTGNYITTESGTSQSFAIECDNLTSYDYTIKVVLKYPGTYTLQLPNGISLQSCNGQSNSNLPAYLEFKYANNERNKDVYLAIPEASRQESPPGYTEALIDARLAFVVKVE